MKLFLAKIYVLLLVLFLAGGIIQAGAVPAQESDDPQTLQPEKERSPETEARQDDEGSMSKPVHIEADRMLSDQSNNVVIFTGNVMAVQGTLTINSEEMTVYHEAGSGGNASGSGDGQRIDKIIATGEVKVSREDLTATGDKVLFELKKERIVVTGNAKVWQEDNLVQCEEVVFDMKKGTTSFESGDRERVQFDFYPKED